MKSKVTSHFAIFKFQDGNGHASVDKYSGQHFPIFSSDTYRMTSRCHVLLLPYMGTTQPDCAHIRVLKTANPHWRWAQWMCTAWEVSMSQMGSQRVRFQLRQAKVALHRQFTVPKSPACWPPLLATFSILAAPDPGSWLAAGSFTLAGCFFLLGNHLQRAGCILQDWGVFIAQLASIYTELLLSEWNVMLQAEQIIGDTLHFSLIIKK